MEQHAIPQHVSSYEFRLVGDMTLRQFAKLAAGLAVAFLFYVLPLPAYFKWPLVLLFALFGVALAFIPIQERPLETWIVSFIRAIYSPTEYVFRKQPTLPDFLESEGIKPAVAPPTQVSASPRVTPRKLEEYLGGLATGPKTSWEEAEAKYLARVKAAFAATPPPVSPPPPPKSSPPSPPVFSPAIPLPSVNLPNIISGMIFNREGKLVEGAIIEIKDNIGYPVRALKSNKLGQFKIATPLEDGGYQLQIEKEGLNFDIIGIELTGEALKPLLIKAV
jgi:hypothetical protein